MTELLVEAGRTEGQYWKDLALSRTVLLSWLARPSGTVQANSRGCKLVATSAAFDSAYIDASLREAGQNAVRRVALSAVGSLRYASVAILLDSHFRQRKQPGLEFQSDRENLFSAPYPGGQLDHHDFC